MITSQSESDKKRSDLENVADQIIRRGGKPDDNGVRTSEVTLCGVVNITRFFHFWWEDCLYFAVMKQAETRDNGEDIQPTSHASYDWWVCRGPFLSSSRLWEKQANDAWDAISK